jgi:hypothetical protein
VRIGASSAGSDCCRTCSAERKDLKGPPDSGVRAAARSLAVNASRPSLLVHALRLVGEQHRVAVEGEAQLVAARVGALV